MMSIQRTSAVCALWLASGGLALAHEAHGHGGHGAGGHAHHGAAAAANTQPAPGVAVRDCWIRAMPQNLPSAGYFTVENSGQQPLTLSAVRSPAFGQTMLHRTATHDGVARMEHVDGVEIAPGARLEFAPGGYHAMLEQPTAALTPGETIAMQFQFGEAGQAQADCAVRKPGDMPKR